MLIYCDQCAEVHPEGQPCDATPDDDLDDPDAVRYDGQDQGQTRLNAYATDLDPLTDAERDVYREVECRDVGVRQLARRTDRSPGTVGNLLASAREKLPDEHASTTSGPPAVTTGGP